MRGLTSCMVVMVLALCAVPALVSAEAPTWRIQETYLGPMLLPAPPQSFMTCVSGHVAYVTERGARVMVVLDGVLGPEFHQIGDDEDDAIHFSPDGKHVAYTTGHHGAESLVVDGTIGPAFWGVSEATFSPDGKRIGYRAQQDDREFMVIDDKPEPEFDKVSGLVFSADSLHEAYFAYKRNKGDLIVLDGVPGPWFNSSEAFGNPVLSSNGGQVACAIQDGEKGYVVLNGRAGPKFDFVWGLVFSNDGRLAYAAEQGGKGFVMLAGVKQPVSGDTVGSPQFSPDGRRLAYYVKQGDKTYVVMDNERGPWLEEVVDLDYSKPVFSLDSGRFAYSGARGDKSFVVVDGELGAALSGAGEPVFSPDSQHVACAVQKAGNGPWSVMLDNVVGPEFEELQDKSLVFSPDSKHLAYAAAHGDEAFVVIDAQRGPAYDQILEGAGPFFHDHGTLEYLAIKETKLYRIIATPM